MRLYAGSASDFIHLNTENKLVDLLREQFLKQFGYNPSHNEAMSWRHSLFRLSYIMERQNLQDQGVMVEYKLPLSAKRIDVVIYGHNEQQHKQAVIVELKQWEKCEFTDYDSEYVLTWVGGGHRSVLHPSIQVGNYLYYLKENNSAFYQEKDPIQVSACSYLHNYNISNDTTLQDQRFEEAVKRFPMYGSEDSSQLSAFIYSRVGAGEGMSILQEVEQSKLRPSKKLLKQVSGVIKQKLKGELQLFGQVKAKGDYILLDEQLIVYDTVMSLAKKARDNQKYAVIVKGGAGTGKSVVGLQLLADLTASNINAHYATGSKSFTETLRKILGKEANSLLKYFMSYGDAEPNSIDVLLMDEAHRIRERTGYPFKSTGRLQIEDLLRAARISVFFVDDYQAVRRGEIGQSIFIRQQAEKIGCTVYEYNLESQFRNGGSEKYSQWIDHTLHIRETATTEWKQEDNFEFQIMDSPQAVEQAIRDKLAEGYSGRMMAGFCWPWTKQADAGGELHKDVVVGDYIRPWNADEKTKGMHRGIPKSQYWAYEDAGIDQVGCIYTAQGFGFDYAGVIFGTDLRYNPDTAEWEGFRENSHDSAVKGADFLQMVKNTYRVLLGRGMKACYVYFMDKETERYFRSRVRK
ncbi:DNA/RNA helicase domain-containing protein [Sphingobacterium puteale]|uniref:DNA/RNA helicase domain-containing protein n=1 Tax=Sphingobacterium puteale TaxID=2420510 RepID=UPI003D98114C